MFLLAVAPASQAEADDSLGPVWCFDGEKWLGYFNGIPGSASRREFTECLQRGAARGEVVAIEGRLGEGNVWFEAHGEVFARRTMIAGSIASGSPWFEFTAYEDRVEFGYSGCSYVLRGNSIELALQGSGVCGLEHSLIAEDQVTDPDFTIYVVGRQFVIVGDSGWHHISEDWTGQDSDPTPRSGVSLYDRFPGVWVGTQRREADEYGVRLHPVLEPVAGPDWNHSAYRFFDWEKPVLREAVPEEFFLADRGLVFNNRDEYWEGVSAWIDAIMDDLFHGQAEPVELSNERIWVYDSFTIGRTLHLSQRNTADLFRELAHIVAELRAGFGGTYTATWLMFWERYVPGFDRQVALKLADRYGVEVGQPAPVRELSDRTDHARMLINQRAPASPSDHEPIAPSELFRRVVLEVGRRYEFGEENILVTDAEVPPCTEERQGVDGSTFTKVHLPKGRSTVNPEGLWNGLNVIGFGVFPGGPDGVLVKGIPSAPGRVRVEITTQCPGGDAQEPRLVGYSEIIVVEPEPDE